MTALQVTVVLLSLSCGALARGYGQGIASPFGVASPGFPPGISGRPGIGRGVATGSYYGGGSVFPRISTGANSGLMGVGTGSGRLGPGGASIGGYPSGTGGVRASYGGSQLPDQGSYQFSDGFGGSQFKTEESDGSGSVRGTYGYMDIQGLYRVVEYVADQYGFRVVVNTNEPGVDGKESPADVTMVVGQTPAGIQEQYTPTTFPGYGAGAAGGGLRGSFGMSPGAFAGIGPFSGPLGGVRGGALGYPSPVGGAPGRFPSSLGAIGQTGVIGFGSRGLGQVGSYGGLPGLTGGNYPESVQGAIRSMSGPFSGIPLSTSGKSI